jgi:hypothetical protein
MLRWISSCGLQKGSFSKAKWTVTCDFSPCQFGVYCLVKSDECHFADVIDVTDLTVGCIT